MLTRLATIYVCTVVAFLSGVYVSRVETGPLIIARNYIDEFYAFAEGHSQEETTFIQKVVSEFTGTQRVDITKSFEYKPAEDGSRNIQRFMFPNGYELEVRGGIPSGTVFAKLFQFDESGETLNNSLLVFINKNLEMKAVRLPYSIDFFVDDQGLLLLSKDKIRQYDICADTLKWELTGAFHHYFNPNDRYIPALGSVMSEAAVERELSLDNVRVFSDANHNITVLDRKTGAVAYSFDFNDIAQKNIGKFDPLVIEKTSENRREIEPGVLVNTKDYWHPNSVAMYPFAASELGFNDNDILVSAKGYNLVFVVNSETLDIKWYSQGILQGQHDANWISESAFTVFNNRSQANPSKNYSSIMKFDFQDGKWTGVWDGKISSAVTWHSGGHAMLGQYSMATLTKQGRHLIGDTKTGESLAEIYLLKEAELINVQEAKLLDERYFNEFVSCKTTL